MLASLIVQRVAAGWALRGQNQALASIILLSKLGLVLLVTYLVLSVDWIDPIGFTTGVTTLLVAIVIDVCYSQGSSSATTRGAD